MGSTSWSDDHYSSRVADRAARGVTGLDHDHAVRTGKAARAVHDDLNPRGKIRESRDSAEHPNSVAIGVIFDETGSMGGIPTQLQAKLPQLMGLLLRQGYVADPQILFGGVGDFYADKAPLQVGQFESGAEMDDELNKLFLESGGGGSFHESYQNAFLFFGRKTSIDCYEKRGRKGYLFIIGDELPYGSATRAEVLDLLGDTVQADIPVEQCVAEAQEKYHCFFIIPRGASHSTDPKLKARWQELVGPQNVIMLDDPDAVCEAIATTIGVMEGSTSLDGAAADLAKSGSGTSIVKSVTAGLAHVAGGAAMQKRAEAELPQGDRPEGTARL